MTVLVALLFPSAPLAPPLRMCCASDPRPSSPHLFLVFPFWFLSGRRAALRLMFIAARFVAPMWRTRTRVQACLCVCACFPFFFRVCLCFFFWFSRCLLRTACPRERGPRRVSCTPPFGSFFPSCRPSFVAAEAKRECGPSARAFAFVFFRFGICCVCSGASCRGRRKAARKRGRRRHASMRPHRTRHLSCFSGGATQACAATADSDASPALHTTRRATMR